MRFLTFVALLLATACVHDHGRYVWVDEYREPSGLDEEYVIRAGDTLQIRVYQQEAMSARVRVRSDGKISLPFLNDVAAEGLTPSALANQVQQRFKEYVNNPVVTVSLEELRSLSVSVVGEVSKSGVYTLDSGAGVLQALAAAGGFSAFARQEVFVLRPVGPLASPTRIRFDAKALLRAEGRAAMFRLRPGDSLVIE